jgi:hypothetical protein
MRFIDAPSPRSCSTVTALSLAVLAGALIGKSPSAAAPISPPPGALLLASRRGVRRRRRPRLRSRRHCRRMGGRAAGARILLALHQCQPSAGIPGRLSVNRARERIR